MANPQLLADWQAADLLAQAAQDICSNAIRAGRSPTNEELEEAERLRAIASGKLRDMVAGLKATTPLR